MRRGPRSPAAGHASTGTAPILAPTVAVDFSRFGTLNLVFAPLNLPSLHFAQTTPNRHGSISNRHLVRLKITATRPESTTSLFLIVPKRPHFTATHFHSPETLVAQARPACVRFHPQSRLTHSISTVYSVRLENAASPAASTKTQLLLCTPTQFSYGEKH